MSFHNARPDKRLSTVPLKHTWTYEEVSTVLRERVGLTHTSSTKAFIKAKQGKTSQTLNLADLTKMLLNLNIDVSRF